MREMTHLLGILKRELRARGTTYAEIARHLGLSEAGVKRLFSTGRMDISRFDALCALAGLDIAELVRVAEQRDRIIERLTHAQEEEIVSDVNRLIVAVCVRNGWTFKEIVDQYDIDEHDCIRHLAALDRVGLIELLPENRIRNKVRSEFRWLPDGPIERFFNRHVLRDFLKGQFDQSADIRLFVNGSLSAQARAQLETRIQTLVNELRGELESERSLPRASKQPFGMLIACREWVFSEFEERKR